MSELFCKPVAVDNATAQLICHGEGLWSVILKFHNFPPRHIHHVCYREAFFFVKYLDDLDFTFVHDYICNTVGVN